MQARQIILQHTSYTDKLLEFALFIWPLCLQTVLSDLGMLDGKSAGEAALFTANHIRVADANAAAQGQGLSFEAFCKFYDTLVMNKARQQLRFKLGLQAEGTWLVQHNRQVASAAQTWAIRPLHSCFFGRSPFITTVSSH